MVFNATFNNISVISWPLVLLVEKTWVHREKPPTCRKLPCRKLPTNFITQCCIRHTSPWAGFELTTLEVIVTDCKGSCKTVYHTIMSTTVPKIYLYKWINKLCLLITKKPLKFLKNIFLKLLQIYDSGLSTVQFTQVLWIIAHVAVNQTNIRSWPWWPPSLHRFYNITYMYTMSTWPL